MWLQIRLGSAAQGWDTAGRQRRQRSREQAWGSHGSSKGPVKEPREDGLINIITALFFQKQTASVGKPGSSGNGMMDGVCIYRKGTGRSPQPGLEESRMKTRATEWLGKRRGQMANSDIFLRS